MLVKDNEYLQEAAESLYVLNADEIARQHCIAREDAERRERTLEKAVEKERKEKESALQEKEDALREVERLRTLLAQSEISENE